MKNVSYFFSYSLFVDRKPIKHKRNSKKKVSHTFPYKEQTFSKLKYFLIFVIKCFSSFCNVFFYTQPEKKFIKKQLTMNKI